MSGSQAAPVYWFWWRCKARTHSPILLTSSVRISFRVKSLDVAHLVRKPSKLEMLMSIMFCTNSHCCKAFCKLRCCSSLFVISSFIVWREAGFKSHSLQFKTKKKKKKRFSFLIIIIKKCFLKKEIQRRNVEECTELSEPQNAMKRSDGGLQTHFEPWQSHCNNSARGSCCFIKVSRSKHKIKMLSGTKRLAKASTGCPSLSNGCFRKKRKKK